jgi:DNA-binding transcriptional regulator YiaG
MSLSIKLTPKSIKDLREKKNLSQEKMANLLGVSTSAVIRWEQGTATPTAGLTHTLYIRKVTQSARAGTCDHTMLCC